MSRSDHDPSLKEIAQVYLNKTIEGHREALSRIDRTNADAVLATTGMISFLSLITLSEVDDTDTGEGAGYVDPLPWLRLASGTRVVWFQCEAFISDDGVTTPLLRAHPDLLDDAHFFALDNAKVFPDVLGWASEYEMTTDEDRDAYERTLCFAARCFIAINEGEAAGVTIRRIAGLPARCPKRFIELVEEQRPRALVIVAHIFAIVKLLERNIRLWLRNIADRQVMQIYAKLPVGWRDVMKWPMHVLEQANAISPPVRVAKPHDPRTSNVRAALME